jgi:hypothetical protein
MSNIYITDLCVQCAGSGEARRRSARLHSLRLWSSGPARIHGIYACDRFASHGACKWTSSPVRVEIKVILHIHKVHVRGYMSGTCCRETGKPSPYSRKTRRSPRCVQRKESRLVARRSWTVWARIQCPMNVEATKSLATALSLFSPISNPKTSFL